jgi:transposase
VMIDSTQLETHPTAPSLLKKGDSPRLIGRTKGVLNSKLHAVAATPAGPLSFFSQKDKWATHKGAALIYPMLPGAETLIADKGYDSDAFREALAGRGITPCIPPRAKCRLPATYCRTLYRQRHKVENMFATLKDWRRISMRYDRCAYTFFGAFCIAATVIFSLGQWVLTLVARLHQSEREAFGIWNADPLAARHLHQSKQAGRRSTEQGTLLPNGCFRASPPAIWAEPRRVRPSGSGDAGAADWILISTERLIDSSNP